MTKRCTECYEVYEADQNFCEVDGQALLADPTLPLIEDPRPGPVSADPRTAWFTGIVGLMAGILICVGLYVVYSLLTIQGDSGRDDSAVTDRIDRDSFQQDRRPTPSSDSTLAEPTEEASKEGDAEEVTEELVAPAPAAINDSKVAARLNRGPVSTSERKLDTEDPTVRTVIEMNDGTEADVDAAWEDSKGVWYRRGSVVSFVESNRVKAITTRTEPSSP